MMDRLLREGNPPTGQLASPKPQYKDVQTNNWEELKGEGGASYVKDKDVFAKLEQARALLDAISGKDFATQTTLAAVLAKLADLESELATIKANQLSGDQKVQLSGTNLEIVKVHTSATSVWQAWGETVVMSSTDHPNPLDMSKYTERAVMVINNTDVVAINIAVQMYTPGVFGGSLTGLLRLDNIPAGAKALITADEVPEIDKPYTHISFRSRNLERTTGEMIVAFLGRA